MNKMAKRKKKSEKKSNKKDSKKEKEKNEPEKVVEREQGGSCKHEDGERKRNASGKNRGKRNSSGGKKSKEINSFKLMTEDILMETKAPVVNTNNSNSRDYVESFNPENLRTFKDKTVEDVTEESPDTSTDDEEKDTKERLLQKHLEQFKELMAVQPKRHTEAQILEENRRLQASKQQQQNKELEKRRKSSVESMVRGDSEKKRQEYLEKQQEMEKKRNQEEMDELQQSGAEKKVKSVDKRKNTHTSASQNVPKKTWGYVPSDSHISPPDPVVWPTVKTVHQENIWSERDRKQKQMETLMPKTSEEEEEMIKQALELSKQTAEEESQYQRLFNAAADLSDNFLVNRISMESQQLSEWFSSTTKVNKPLHRNKQEKSRLPPSTIISPPIDSTTNWDDRYQLEPKSPQWTTNPRDKASGCKKQQRTLIQKSSVLERGKWMEKYDSWVSEEVSPEDKFQEIGCSKALESHQELMESEKRTGFSGMDSKVETSKGSQLVDSVDNEYYDPNGGARPKCTDNNNMASSTKYRERKNKKLRNENERKLKTSSYQNTPTVYKYPKEIDKNNPNIHGDTLNKSKAFQTHSVENIESLEDHVKANKDNDFVFDSAEDWNCDIDYIGPECDPDLKSTHLTYSGVNPKTFPKPQVITASLPKVSKDTKEQDGAFYENDLSDKSKNREQKCAFNPLSEQRYLDKSKGQGQCYTISSDDECANESNGEQVKDTLQNSDNIDNLNEKSGTEMNEVQSVATCTESSLNVSVPRSEARGVCFKSARTKFSEAKSLYLSSQRQKCPSSVRKTGASLVSRNDRKHNFPAYPKCLIKDSSEADQTASMSASSCNIAQSRTLEHCSKFQQSTNEKQIVDDTVLCSRESLVNSRPAIPNLPKSCISPRPHPEVKESQATNDQEQPTNVNIPLNLPSHLVNAYLLFLQEQEAKGKSSQSNNTTQLNLESTQIDIEKSNASKYTNVMNLNPIDLHDGNRPEELHSPKGDSEKEMGCFKPRDQFSDKIKTSQIDYIAQNDMKSSIKSSKLFEEKLVNSSTVETAGSINVFPCSTNSSTLTSKSTNMNTPTPQSYREENSTSPKTSSTSNPELVDCGPKADDQSILSIANTCPNNTLNRGPNQTPNIGVLNRMYTGMLPLGNCVSGYGTTSVGYPSTTNNGIFSCVVPERTDTTKSHGNLRTLGQNQGPHFGLAGSGQFLPNVIPYSFNASASPMNIPGNVPCAKNLTLNNVPPQIPLHYSAYNNNPYIMTMGNAPTGVKSHPVFMLSKHQAQNERQKIPEVENGSLAVPENSAKISNCQPKLALTSKERQRLKKEKLQKVKSLIEEVRKEKLLNSGMNLQEEV